MLSTRPRPDAESALNAFFDAHGRHGSGAVLSLLKNPKEAFTAQSRIGRLDVLDAWIGEGAEDDIVRAGLERTNQFARMLIRGTTAVLVMPDTLDEFLAGSSESKRSLRTKFNRATRAGYRVRRLTTEAEKRELLAIADAYERAHPDPFYRNDHPSNEYLLDCATWLVAETAEGKPMILAVPAISGEWATLQHFKTLEASDETRLARHWMSVELVRELQAQGVHYLADVLSPIGLPSGLRDFQRRLGYRLHRVRVH